MHSITGPVYGIVHIAEQKYTYIVVTSLVPDLMMRPNVYWVSDGLKKSMITYLQNEDKKKDTR